MCELSEQELNTEKKNESERKKCREEQNNMNTNVYTHNEKRCQIITIDSRIATSQTDN